MKHKNNVNIYINAKLYIKFIQYVLRIVFFFFLLVGGIFSVNAQEEENEKTFVVSAYYSPLPNQQSYVRGSYEAEKQLQGEGVRGADYTKVYAGMIAAPKSYEFGTKIFIPGLGVGTVHDRGGSIYEYDKFDRIDVWMGYGDEGRKRALEWGIRKVKGKIMPKNTPENLDFTHIPVAKEMYNFYKNYPNIISKKINKNSSSLFLGSKGKRVKSLQSFLKREGFFEGRETGYFGPRTKKAVFEFQKFYSIVQKESDVGAGVYGPLTQAKVKELWFEDASLRKYAVDIEILPIGIGIGEKGSHVKRLQLILKTLGYFTEEPNGIFGPKTQKSVLAFQKSQKIINKNTDIGAGYFGPKTHKMLSRKLLEKRKNAKKQLYFDIKNVSAQTLAKIRNNKNVKYF